MAHSTMVDEIQQIIKVLRYFPAFALVSNKVRDVVTYTSAHTHKHTPSFATKFRLNDKYETKQN